MDDTTLPAPGELPARGDEPQISGTAAEAGADGDDGDGGDGGDPARTGPKKRRRGSRGGKGRKRPAGSPGVTDDDDDDDGPDDIDVDEPTEVASTPRAPRVAADPEDQPEMPERIGEGRPSVEAAEQALVRRPQIGDTRPAIGDTRPATAPVAARGGRAAKSPTGSGTATGAGAGDAESTGPKKRRRGGKGRGAGAGGAGAGAGGGGGGGVVTSSRSGAVEVDPDVLEKRKGRERNGRPVGRYLMSVQVRPTLTQVAVLEGRNLIEHYVSRPADDISQIHGNIYLGKVQNVLPGMEAAFVDIATPKNAVLYRGDVQYDAEDIEEKSNNLRIEQMLKAKQLIICQITKNPIGAKGARLTQEVSLPGRFVVLIPNSKTYGISKRLPDDVRKRLRNILDRVKPAEHGLIVRTAAENATEHELRADMTRLLDQWNAIEAKAKKANSPTLLYREPELAVRVIREEFNAEYRGVVIDDRRLYDDVKDYVTAFNPELADRIEFHDPDASGLPLYEVHHIHEQLHKALDRKVWLPSGGSLIIEHTEALTVIDVNTGKNVGTTNLEETVFRNNLEAAEEVAKQLRLRDIGGIVVIDFIDMEIRDNRRKVVEAFRNALARDKTRTQVFDISELGLVEMTRKRIGEGLLTNFADQCPICEGRGVVIDHALLG
ncbi:MAG: Rne/Rng family ribonuclease [Ilumatobacteraceae bacterium]